MSSSTSSSSPIGAARDATPVEAWSTGRFWLRALLWPAALLAIAELGSRVASPVFLENPDPRQVEVVAPGYRGLRPNAALDINVGGKRLTAQINADGFRDAPWQPGSDCVIIGVGNSYVANWSIEQRDMWSAQLQQRLAAAEPGRRCAVRSAGVHGWSLAEIAAALAHRLLAQKPAVVVLAFNHQTMWTPVPIDDAAIDRAVAQWNAQPPAAPQAQPQPEPTAMARVIGLYNDIERHSALLGTLKVYAPMLPLTLGLTQLAVPPVYRKAEFAARREPTLQALEALRRRVAASGAELLVMVVPSLPELDPDVYDLMLAAYGGSDRDLDLRAPSQVLHAWAQQRGVPVVDLAERFRGHRPAPMSYVDYHWNEEGNALAAAALEAPVRAILAAPRRAP